MTDEVDEMSAASRGSQDDPLLVCCRHLANSQVIIERKNAEIERLHDAIRRLAEQDATLSVCDGNVTVTIDNSLSPVDRLAIEWAAATARKDSQIAVHKTLRRLLERLV